jgi:N-acyl-D-amino-acid deacylase
MFELRNSGLRILPNVMGNKKINMKQIIIGILLIVVVAGCSSTHTFDVLIKNGQIVDGSGNASFTADIGINDDKIAAIGNLQNAKGNTEIDATGLVVAPGFINMLSWAFESLIEDGKSQSDIRQGVTLEVLGEGWSAGPITPSSEQALREIGSGNIDYEFAWNTLGEYLEFLENKGVSTNVASFVGATTLRINTVGFEDRSPTADEMEAMKAMVKQAMEEGAMGIGSSLIYAPASYSSTEELIELCKVASAYDGMYISHMRSEGGRLLESLDELIKIANEADIRAEVYHFKQAGKMNWGKYEAATSKIDSARKAGLHITTNMYTYTAGATGLNASMPTWVQEGGYEKWVERLQVPEIRKRLLVEMTTPSDDWENYLMAAGSPDKVLLVGFKNDTLKYLTGKTLAEVARLRNTSPEEAAMDLVIQDGGRVDAVYFLMSEENVKKQIQLPYMSFGSDEVSSAPEGVFLKSSNHPRAYGNVARLLGKYVREEKLISLEEAIYKLSGLPASNLKITNRGLLKEGYFADLTVFDPNKIQDHATFDKPQQYSTGMEHVFVNGTQVLKNGEHTGALPGKVVRGPGWAKK